MEKRFEEYESKLETNGKLGRHHYQEDFDTNLKEDCIVPMAKLVCTKLDWDIVYYDTRTIEAYRKDDWDKWTEKITISYDLRGKVYVNSKSLNSESWDSGRNAKRVKLFIHAFQETAKEYNEEGLLALAQDFERSYNMDDYIIPNVLPLPQREQKPSALIPMSGGFMLALLVGYATAFLEINLMYVMALFEVGIIFALTFGFNYLMKWGNYTDCKKLRLIMLGAFCVVFICNKYFSYDAMIRKSTYTHEGISFVNYIQLLFTDGIHVMFAEYGWIGFIGACIFQIGLPFVIACALFEPHLIRYQMYRIPPEVAKFAIFYLKKGEDEEQVRNRLEAMGWKEKWQQDEVFECVDANSNAINLQRGR